jgi:hypothetical protein
MKKILLLFLCVCFSNMFSQDTLFHRSGEIQAVKVSEINPQLIKYKKFENLNGPVYSISKSDVKRIKYSGGQIDSFDVSVAPAIVVVTPSVAVEVKPVKNTMICLSNKIFYNQNEIDNEELLSVINNFPDASAKKKMKISYKQMRAHGDIAATSLACGLVLGCAVVVATAPFVTGLTDEFLLPTDEGMQVAVIGILCGGAMRITGFAVSQSQRNKKKAKMREIVAIYNGDYEFK